MQGCCGVVEGSSGTTPISKGQRTGQREKWCFSANPMESPRAGVALQGCPQFRHRDQAFVCPKLISHWMHAVPGEKAYSWMRQVISISAKGSLQEGRQLN